MNKEETIFHIAQPADVEQLKQNGQYRCDSLDSEGFIHCCERQQLKGVVQRYYQEAEDLMLLIIEPGKLESQLVHENTVGGQELFPHIYGPINAAAIKEIHGFGQGSPHRDSLCT